MNAKQISVDILIVEDEPKLASVVIDFMQASGYTTLWLSNGLGVEAAVATYSPQLIILDLMLPGRNGKDVCRDLREHSEVPIIMVTAQAEEVDRLLGLEIGADDYVCKPFSQLELVARVKAILRRSRLAGPEASGPLQLNENTLQAIYKGLVIDFTAIEFRLLKTLASKPARVFSRKTLMHQLYTDGRLVEDRTIDSHVKKIRRKFATAFPDDDLIQSVYAAGFKLVM